MACAHFAKLISIYASHSFIIGLFVIFNWYLRRHTALQNFSPETYALQPANGCLPLRVRLACDKSESAIVRMRP